MEKKNISEEKKLEGNIFVISKSCSFRNGFDKVNKIRRRRKNIHIVANILEMAQKAI
jgi:hypothetical protein